MSGEIYFRSTIFEVDIFFLAFMQSNFKTRVAATYEYLSSFAYVWCKMDTQLCKSATMLLPAQMSIKEHQKYQKSNFCLSKFT